MKPYRLYAEKLFNGQRMLTEQVLSINNGTITAIDQNIDNADYYAKGLVVPGFIDLQVNGGGGVLFNQSPSVDHLKTMMKAHCQFGTTAMMPTLITDKVAVMAQAADVIAQALNEKVPGILGIHFEGPHISIAKKGAHSSEFIRTITDAEWDILQRQDIGKIIVTLAPEAVRLDDVKRMVNLGIKVCIGHSNADYKTTQACVDAGASGFTHLYNAMSPLQGREPGVVGAALLNDHTSCGLILDGHHVDYVSAKIALKTKPKGKLFLVTDAMPPVGCDQTEFDFFDRKVTLAEGKLTSSTGELAGSVLTMITAVHNAYHHLDITLEEAIKMATQYPADYLFDQSSQYGKLAVGTKADFVVLDPLLTVQSTWLAGNKVFEANPI